MQVYATMQDQIREERSDTGKMSHNIKHLAHQLHNNVTPNYSVPLYLAGFLFCAPSCNVCSAILKTLKNHVLDFKKNSFEFLLYAHGLQVWLGFVSSSNEVMRFVSSSNEVMRGSMLSLVSAPRSSPTRSRMYRRSRGQQRAPSPASTSPCSPPWTRTAWPPSSLMATHNMQKTTSKYHHNLWGKKTAQYSCVTLWMSVFVTIIRMWGHLSHQLLQVGPIL